MACSLFTLHGIVQDCNGNLGGVSEVWLARRDDVASVVTAETTVSGFTYPEISAITMETGANFVHYYVRKNTSSLSSTLNVSDNGSTYVSTELNLVFARMDAQKRLEMNALSYEDLVALVKTANGNWIYLGYDNPVSRSAGTGETGVQKSDNNQYTITLTDESTEWPYFVTDAAVNAVIG